MKLLKVSAYILFLIALFEGVGRFVMSNESILWSLGAYGDISHRYHWLNQQKLDNHTMHSHKYFQFDSTKGWALSPNLKEVPMYSSPEFRGKSVSSNLSGLRGTEEYSYQKTEGKIRILVIGDSFAFGEEVSDNETYPWFLQQLLPECEVINLGVTAYGHDQILIYLREEGIKYKPDIVVLGFVNQDMWRNTLSFFAYAKPKFDLEKNGLVLSNSPVPPPDVMLKSFRFRSRFVDLMALLYFKKFKSFEASQKQELITDKLLVEIRKTITSIGARPLFFFLPPAQDLLNTDKEGKIWGEDFYQKWCLANEEKFISLTPVFLSNIQAGEKYVAEGHWDAKGNRLIAETICHYIDQ